MHESSSDPGKAGDRYTVHTTENQAPSFLKYYLEEHSTL